MWLLTSVVNVSNQKSWVFSINFSQLDSVDFYVVQDGKVIQQSHQGKAQIEQRFRVPTLRVDIPSGVPIDLYIRVESRSSSLITPLRIQPEPTHDSYYQIDSMLWGLFYGGLFILAIYNLALFFRRKGEKPSCLCWLYFRCHFMAICVGRTHTHSVYK